MLTRWKICLTIFVSTLCFLPPPLLADGKKKDGTCGKNVKEKRSKPARPSVRRDFLPPAGKRKANFFDDVPPALQEIASRVFSSMPTFHKFKKREWLDQFQVRSKKSQSPLLVIGGSGIGVQKGKIFKYKIFDSEGNEVGEFNFDIASTENRVPWITEIENPISKSRDLLIYIKTGRETVPRILHVSFSRKADRKTKVKATVTQLRIALGESIRVRNPEDFIAEICAKYFNEDGINPASLKYRKKYYFHPAGKTKSLDYILAWDGDTLKLEIPNERYLKWIEDNGFLPNFLRAEAMPISVLSPTNQLVMPIDSSIDDEDTIFSIDHSGPSTQWAKPRNGISLELSSENSLGYYTNALEHITGSSTEPKTLFVYRQYHRRTRFGRIFSPKSHIYKLGPRRMLAESVNLIEIQDDYPQILFTALVNGKEYVILLSSNRRENQRDRNRDGRLDVFTADDLTHLGAIRVDRHTPGMGSMSDRIHLGDDLDNDRLRRALSILLSD